MAIEPLEAEPVKRIISNTTDEIVGWLYRWNTGEEMPRWISDCKTDVRFETYEPA